MRTRRKVISLLLIGIFLFSTVGTLSSADTESDPILKSDLVTVNVAIVYSTGGLGDQSFNDAAKLGVDNALTKHGVNFTYDEACTSSCVTITDITNAIDQFAASGEIYDLIIGVGFGAKDGISQSAQAYPDQKFMIIDAIVDLPNVVSVVFGEEEGSFLAGALAAMVSQTGKIGFLGGLDIPLINRFGAGYQAGARYINPAIDMDIRYSPDPSNPWGDVTGGYNVASDMIANGTDIIYAAAGGTGLGVIDAVADANTAAGDTLYYAIGVDSDQDGISQGDVLTSMIKRVDVAVETQIDALFADIWTAGVVTMGLAEDGVGISDMTYTQTEANTSYNATYTRIQLVNVIKQLIINGSIFVPDQFVRNVAIVYSTGGLGDQSFNDMAKEGIDASVAKHAPYLNVDEACQSSCSFGDVDQAIEDFASSTTEYDLIIGVGFAAGDAINYSAVIHPDRNFMIIDYEVDQPNVASVVFREEEGSFLAGALAAMVSQTAKIGFLGGLDIPLINKFGAGFSHGARYIDPTVEITVAYAPDPNNPWGDIAGGKTVAQQMMADGVDIIFAAAGGTGIGVIDAVEEANAGLAEPAYYAIGVDSDQDHLSQGNVLTSMIKHIDVAVSQQIDIVMDRAWSAGSISLGLIENGVGISPMTYTQTEANTAYNTTYTRIELVDRLRELIINGSISVAETFDEVPDRKIMPEPSSYELITISAHPDNLSFNVTEINLQKGTTYNITFINPSTTTGHNLRIDVDGDIGSAGVSDPDDLTIGVPNDDSSGTDYSASVLWTTPNEDTEITFYCGYAGHYAAGEEGTFIIGEGSTSTTTTTSSSASTTTSTTSSSTTSESIDETPQVEFDLQTSTFVVMFALIPLLRRRKHN